MQISGGISIAGGVSLTPPSAGPVNYDGDLTFGTSVVLDSSNPTNSDSVSSVWDPNNSKLIVAYDIEDGANREGYISIGTVTGSSVSYGSAVKFSDQATHGYVNTVSVCYDSNAQKGVVAWGGYNSSVYARTITVTGTTCTLGTVTTLISGSIYPKYIRAVYDSTNYKIVVMFSNDNNNDEGYSYVGTVSGTNISFGSLVKFSTNRTQWIDACFDSNNGKIVVAYENLTSSTGKARVGTISGSSISWGSEISTCTGRARWNGIVYDSTEQRVVLTFGDGTNSYYATTIVGEVSGSNITFGTPVVFWSPSNSPAQEISSTYDVTSKKVINTFYNNSGGGSAKCVVGSVSGSSITYNSVVNFGSGGAQTNAQISHVASIPGARIHITYHDDSNSSRTTGVAATIS
jgi:hypothetical protein